RRVARRVSMHHVEVARVRDDDGELLQLIERIHRETSATGACGARDRLPARHAAASAPIASSTNAVALHTANGTPRRGTFASLHDASAKNSHGAISSRRDCISTRSAKVNAQEAVFAATNCCCSAAASPPKDA